MKRYNAVRMAAFALAAASLVTATGVAAQTAPYPSRTIRFIVPLIPGGGNDLLARIIAERMSAAVGHPVVVENRPGAGGNVGTEYVARQPADGYTLLMTAPTHVINPSFFAKLPYDPIRDFAPVSLIATIPFALTVNASVPAQNAKELIALARSQPGKMTYGTTGIGTPHHLSMEMLRSATGIDVVQVPYKGAGALVPALVSGEINMTIGALNSLLPHVRTGRLRALAVAAPTRTPALPDVPTIAEAAGLPGYGMVSWFGVLVPAATPSPVISRLNAEINRIVQNPQVIKEKLTPVGLEPVGTTPQAFAEVLKTELTRYAKVAKEAGIKPE
jgi:tripartite-type tricarboxylate transporter receptor subunit TctC